MALDRKVRRTFEESAALGADVEMDGNEALKTAYNMLVRGRSQSKDVDGAGTEMLSPENLVLCAEAAILNKRFDLANSVISEFFMQHPPKNQVNSIHNVVIESCRSHIYTQFTIVVV